MVVSICACTGLGAPHWDQYARGNRRNYKRDHKCTYCTCHLEGIAYQVYDLVKAMEADLAKKEN
jgi:glycerol kinase